MNLYCELSAVRSRLGLSGTSQDGALLGVIEAASRVADQMSGRHFYVLSATRVFSGTRGADAQYLVLPDVLSVSSVETDDLRDESYSESWEAGEDYVLEPQAGYPKLGMRRVVGCSSGFTLRGGEAWVRVVGQWGAGNLRDASPWLSLGITGTLADAADTSLSLSAAGTVQAGKTLLLGTEQVYVSALSGTTATVVRGVNGTTAAAHTSAAVYEADYPAVVRRAVEAVSAKLWRDVDRLGLGSETIMNYAYTMVNPVHEERQLARLFGPVRREPGV